jgi:N-acetyl-anhydromuramyl-L-alanine amidase AmpD
MSKQHHKERLHPDVVIERHSPNVSERVAPISLIVLHSTESENVPDSASDLAGVASWFANPASQVSAHVITDADGKSARCVSDRLKAWHCMSFNSAALGIEQIGRAAQPKWERPEWLETARWIAWWSHRYGIPIRRGAVSGESVTRSGIVTHKMLGAAGGGHVDPGPAYPLDKVLEEAARIKKARF